MMTAASMLGACSGCPATELGRAVSYTGEPLAFGTKEQENRWLANTRLDSFIRRTIRSEGVRALSRQHGLQCAVRPGIENCTDCYICTGTTRAEALVFAEPFGSCTSDGTVAIRAEIGPGEKVTSMTYWTPLELRHAK